MSEKYDDLTPEDLAYGPDEETPKEAVEKLLIKANQKVMDMIRERNLAMVDLTGAMERGEHPLPPKGIRSFLLSEIKQQITDCRGWEEVAENQEVKKLVKETADTASEVLTRLQALFVKDGDAPTAN